MLLAFARLNPLFQMKMRRMINNSVQGVDRKKKSPIKIKLSVMMTRENFYGYLLFKIIIILKVKKEDTIIKKDNQIWNMGNLNDVEKIKMMKLMGVKTVDHILTNNI